MIKIAHLSDIHFGAEMLWLGDNRNEYAGILRATFSKAINHVIENDYRVLLITGDLFDTPFPRDAEINFVREEITRLVAKQIYTLILPGNHDRLELNSVYFKHSLGETPYVYVFTNDRAEQVIVQDLDMSVFARPVVKQFSNSSPLAEVSELASRATRSKHNVAMVHGSANFRNSNHGQSNHPISKEEIAQSNFDYIAMGDWHGSLDLSSANTQAWYAGSMELVARDQVNAGNMLEIRLGEGVTNVTPVHLASLRATIVDMDIQKLMGPDHKSTEYLQQAVSTYLKEQSDKFTVFTLNLTGKRPISIQIPVEEMENMHRLGFFNLKINDKTRQQVTESDLVNYPEETLIGRYIRVVQKAIKNSKDNKDDAEMDILQDVLDEGINRLIN